MKNQSRGAVLVGENRLLLDGLSRILADARFSVAATVASMDELLSTPPTTDVPIAIVLDDSGDRRSLLNRVRQFKDRSPHSIVVLLAVHDRLGDDDVIAAFEHGVNGYCPKPTGDILVKSLELALAGETILSSGSFQLTRRDQGSANPQAMECRAEPPMLAHRPAEQSVDYRPRLSAKEQSILRCLIEGDSNKVIARKIDMAEATVKVHVKAILRKVRVNNRTQAAIWGINHNSSMAPVLNGAAKVAEPLNLPYEPDASFRSAQ